MSTIQQIEGTERAFYGWQGIRPALDGIPTTLRAIDQWVLWKAVPKPKGGMNKIPFQPNGRNASSTVPATWSDFGIAWSAYEESKTEYAGVGFVVTDRDDFIGGDLDHCRNQETGALTPIAARISAGIDTYWEITPSGTGIRFFARGEQGRSFKGNGLEVYTSGRFLTVTGEHFRGTAEPTQIDPAHVNRLRELAKGDKSNGAEQSVESADPIVEALKAKGLYQRLREDGRHQITCPWADQHTGGDLTGTVYMEAHHNGHERAVFLCQHSHCANKHLGDLLRILDVEPDKERRDFNLIWFRDANPRIGGPVLLRGVILPESMVVTYGESGSGKTFNVLDRDLCISAGRTWYGREAESGFVLYVAAEGPHSVENRVAAYRQIFMPDMDVPFAILPQGVNLLDRDADTDALIDFIKRTEDRRGTRCVKVTADTLARVICGGNENSPEDMGSVVMSADAIRHAIGCAFEFVHHSGKNTALGARGHSSLRAATDTEIEVSVRDEFHVAKVTKQRDAPEGDEFAYSLRVVELGQDQYGHPVTTCVPEWELDAKCKKSVRLTKQEHAVLRMMKDAMSKEKRLPPTSCFDAPNPPRTGQIACPLSVLRTLTKRIGGVSESDNPDTQERALRRNLNSLRDKAVIRVCDDWAWLADKPDKGGTF